MSTPLDKKSSPDVIRARFDADVERFSNLDTGQQATMDAPLAMELLTRAALTCAPRPRAVLDLGCGAGNNTLKLLLSRDDSSVSCDCDLVDLSRPMLDRAAERMGAYKKEAGGVGTVRAFQEDVRTVDLPAGRYDAILAAAVLHHLRGDDEWQAVFTRLFEWCAPGGGVWISDLVSHEDPAVQALMWARYGAYLEGIGGAEYRKKVFEYIDQEDSPRPLTYQLALLRKAGFATVEVLHKNGCFATFGARKD